jgi:hypothetical protein
MTTRAWLKTAAAAGLLLTTFCMNVSEARKWSDATGGYVFEGDLIGVNDNTAVIQKTGKKRDLVAVAVKQLSKADQQYLKSKEAEEASEKAAGGQQTWTMKSGLKVNARVVDYGRKDITLQRRRSKVYVNDQVFDNLGGVKQKIVLRIVSHFENTPIEDKKALETWILKLKGAPKTYTCDGVVLELENGDEYGVPFFLFSANDLKVLQPGWDTWLAARDARDKKEVAAAERERESLMLQAQAEAYQRDKENEHKMRVMELQLQAVAAGVTDIWEVELLPRNGRGPSRVVVVSGRDSDAAARAALSKFPGYSIGGAAKISHPN